VLETWDELKAEVEAVSLPMPSRGDVVAAGNSDIAASVAPAVLAAPSEATELAPTSSAHSAAQSAEVCAPTLLTDHVPMQGRRDAVTLVVAEVAEASEPPPSDASPPRGRPVLSIVRDTVTDLYTNAREWLARERPIDFGN
jgi:hypothetical protein